LQFFGDLSLHLGFKSVQTVQRPMIA